MARLLLADDSALIRKMSTMSLTKLGFDVIQAEDGCQAYEMAKSEKPDVIFLDAVMPEMDGFESLKAIKDDPDTAGIPVYMCTGDDTEAYIEKASVLGASGYFTKPVNFEEVKEKLNNLIGG